MYLSLAKKLLDNEYKAKRDLADESGKILIEEKIVHSYQVLGAGNMILKNEEIYKDCCEEEIDKLKATVLLHDLGRFEEGVTKGIDHGVYGADLLRGVEEFSKPYILLAVKHHGHLIEDLYEDVEYKILSEEEKEKVKKYIFLVRDADKLANFYLLSRKFEEMEELFIHPSRFKVTSDVSEIIRGDFLGYKAINKKNVTTVAEQALMVLACVFDLNYGASFRFLDKTGAIEKFFRSCEKYFYEKDALIFKNVLFGYMNKMLNKKASV